MAAGRLEFDAPQVVCVVVAALRALHKLPKGRKQTEILMQLVALWGECIGGEFVVRLEDAFKDSLGRHWFTSVIANAKQVQPETDEAARVLLRLELWREQGVLPADPFAQNAGLLADLLVAAGDRAERNNAVASASSCGGTVRLTRLNALRGRAFAELAPERLSLEGGRNDTLSEVADGSLSQGPSDGAGASAMPVSIVKRRREESQFKLIPVWFGTDRKRSTSASASRYTGFGEDRGADAVQYGLAEVSIPKTHAEGELERPGGRWDFLKDDTEYPSQHIVIHSIEVLAQGDWAREVEGHGQEGLLFIHGYNVSFEEAIWRTAQLANDLKFTGQAFCFSWASAASYLSYGADEATIEWSKPHLAAFLEALCKDVGLTKLHIIAHSMGNRALLNTLETWNTPGTKISQVVLASPDIDADRFRQIATVFGKFDQVTLYASRADKAISLSRIWHRRSRAADAKPPIVLSGLSTIDATREGASWFDLAHSDFANVTHVFRDLFYVINQGLLPAQRAGLQVVTPDGYYQFQQS